MSDFKLQPFYAPADGPRKSDLPGHILILAAVWVFSTLLFFLCRPGYTFPLVNNWIDNWVYIGYQWDFRGQMAEFGPTYYGARLSAILPAAGMHECLPPGLANIAVKLLFSALLATGCATVAFRIGGFHAGFLAVVLSVACPQVVEMWHNGYVDGYLVVYAILTLACIVAASHSRWWAAWIFVAGSAFTAMVVANLSAVMAPGLGLAVFALCWLRWKPMRLAAGAGVFLAGAGALFLVFGGLNVHFGGAFNFIKPQIDAARALSALPRNPWAPTDWEWVTRATWLVLPLGALVWGVGRLWFRPPLELSVPVHQAIRALTLGLLTSLVMVFLFGLRGGMGLLASSFAASFQLCLALPLLALLCASFRQSPPPSLRWLALTLGALLLVSLGNVSVVTAHLPLHGHPDRVRVLSVAAFTGACAIVAACRFGSGKWWHKYLRPEVVLVALVIGSTSSTYPYPAAQLRESYVSVHSAFQKISNSFVPGSYRLWEHPGQRDSRSLASTRLWGYRLFTQKPFPQFDTDSLANLADRTVIITAPRGSGHQTLAEAKSALARFANVTSEQIIEVPGDVGTGFDLVTLSLGEKPVGPEVHGSQQLMGRPLLDLNSSSSVPYFETLAKNLYGSAGMVQSALTTAAGVTRFKRTDQRDHLATAFIMLTLPPDVSRQLTIIISMPCDSQTLLVVQDEVYQYLKQIPLSKAGQHTYAVNLPPTSQRIRIFFAGLTDTATALPEHVTIYENRGEVLRTGNQ